MSKQRMVVVTGAGTGIGEAGAKRLAASGARVALVGRRRAPPERVARETGGLVLDGDAASADDWAHFIAQIKSCGGHIDAPIACAGGLGAGAAADTDDAAWRAAMRANLDTAFVSARACVPDLVARRGAI